MADLSAFENPSSVYSKCVDLQGKFGFSEFRHGLSLWILILLNCIIQVSTTIVRSGNMFTFLWRVLDLDLPYMIEMPILPKMTGDYRLFTSQNKYPLINIFN